MQIRRDSRFVTVPLYTYIDTTTAVEYFWGLPRRLEFVDDDEFVDHYPKENEQLHQIAFHYYGNSFLWWVIAQVNDVYRPWDLPTDAPLRIPSKTTLARLLA
jgi:hypothetical protein